MTIDAALAAVAPRLTVDQRATWLDALAAPMTGAAINTPRRIAAFLGQAAHESGGFLYLSENLNYSAIALCHAWPARFPNLASCVGYEHAPQSLANKVYGGRLGNVNVDDGWHFRGGGIFQVTGRANYTAFAHACGMDVETAADWCRTPAGASSSAAWFWSSRQLNGPADLWALTAITRTINGPSCLGLAERQRLCNVALAKLS